MVTTTDFDDRSVTTTSPHPHSRLLPPAPVPPPLERMLGLNPQFQGAHPFHSMFPGLHAANMAAAAAAASSSANVIPPPPISTPSSLPSPGGPGSSIRGRDGVGLGQHGAAHHHHGAPPPPPHPMNVPPINIWALWNHFNK